jgi:hypothetical protein
MGFNLAFKGIMAACNLYLATSYMAITSVPTEMDVKKLVKTEIGNCSK